MKIRRSYFIAGTFICLLSTVNAMQQAYDKICGASVLMCSLARAGVREELPEHSTQNQLVDSQSTGGWVVTYKGNNAYIQKFLELVGPTTSALDEEPEDRAQMINASTQIRAGHWKMSTEQDAFLSTGNVCEGVTIVLQQAEKGLVALYHYNESADENFKKLGEFVDEIRAKADQVSINQSDFKVSLISSYLSTNFVIIKRIFEALGFTISLCHLRPRAWLEKGVFANSDEDTTLLGRLIFASPSELFIYKSNVDDPGSYDSDLSDDKCCLM